MTNAECKIRLNVAIEVAEHVHSDLCHEWTEEISREKLMDLVDIIVKLRYFAESLGTEDKTEGSRIVWDSNH